MIPTVIALVTKEALRVFVSNLLDFEFLHQYDTFQNITFNTKVTKTFGHISLHPLQFYIKDNFIKCDQIHIFMRIWSHLLKKSVMENFIICPVTTRQYEARKWPKNIWTEIILTKDAAQKIRF